MKGRQSFSSSERDEIRLLLRAKQAAERDEQKRIRGRLRNTLGFHISDWSSDASAFTVADFDSLVASGQVTIDRAISPLSPDIDLSILQHTLAEAAAPATPPTHAASTEPEAFTRVSLEHRGFTGFITFEQLRRDGFSTVPKLGGVYVVLHPGDAEPKFLDRSIGGHFKGRDPTVPPDVLSAKWIKAATCVYIGKADVLRRRIREFARYGAGEPVGHQGGRYIWQLAEAGDLVIAWMETPDEIPREVEIRLLAEFAASHGGQKPFANIAS